jgi:hypothetical protein
LFPLEGEAEDTAGPQGAEEASARGNREAVAHKRSSEEEYVDL